MGFAPVNYSSMFDNINQLTDRNDIIKALCFTTYYNKKYITNLCKLSKVVSNKAIWYLEDLERFFGMQISGTMPFFRPEFFISGWDYNAHTVDDKFREYVTVCGLKKILLILGIVNTLSE